MPIGKRCAIHATAIVVSRCRRLAMHAFYRSFFAFHSSSFCVHLRSANSFHTNRSAFSSALPGLHLRFESANVFELVKIAVERRHRKAAT
jgi:hypothetical protein